MAASLTDRDGTNLSNGRACEINLLGLPQEIRNHIYMYLLEEGRHGLDLNRERLWPETVRKSQRETLSPFRFLRLTCRQISGQVKPIFFGRNMFVVDAIELTDPTLLRVPDKHINLMKGIEFYGLHEEELWFLIIKRRAETAAVTLQIREECLWRLESDKLEQPSKQLETDPKLRALAEKTKPAIQMLQRSLSHGGKMDRSLLEAVTVILARGRPGS